MKLSFFAVVAALQLAAVSADVHVRHPHNLLKRQGPPGGSSSSPPPVTSPPATTTSSPAALPPPPPPSTPHAGTTTTTPGPPPPAGPTPPVAPGSTPGATVPPGASAPTSSGATASTTTSVNTGPPPAATGTGIPPLDQISSGMPTRATLGATATFTPGARPPISGVPPLPTPFSFVASAWPLEDKVPPIDSPEVVAWMKELDGVDIPDLDPTVDGTCLSSPAEAADAANRGWWTCGGWVRPTDITNCPTKNTWGVSFDDGPAPYTQYLLNYLSQVKINATFFVVGSRVIERPAVLIEEYMSGHEISVHTWSHHALTTLTNAQIVAELGWTRKAINTVLGVTPTTMRPPYGDIDDRVRAISLAMGMVPIMWSRTPLATFDTNDWRVPAGIVNATDSFNTFQSILSNATTMDTGFIVLEHDLFEITVDLAVGYFLPYAQSFTPKLTLEPIGKCVGIPATDLYLESNTNTSFPVTKAVDVDGDGASDTISGNGGKSPASSTTSPASALDVSFALSSSLIAVAAAALASLL